MLHGSACFHCCRILVSHTHRRSLTLFSFLRFVWFKNCILFYAFATKTRICLSFIAYSNTTFFRKVINALACGNFSSDLISITHVDLPDLGPFVDE